MTYICHLPDLLRSGNQEYASPARRLFCEAHWYNLDICWLCRMTDAPPLDYKFRRRKLVERIYLARSLVAWYRQVCVRCRSQVLILHPQICGHQSWQLKRHCDGPNTKFSERALQRREYSTCKASNFPRTLRT